MLKGIIIRSFQNNMAHTSILIKLLVIFKKPTTSIIFFKHFLATVRFDNMKFNNLCIQKHFLNITIEKCKNNYVQLLILQFSSYPLLS